MAGQEAQGLLAVWTDIAPEAEAEFNEWYNTEHIPQLVGIPGIISGRRYQAVEGSPKYLALYDLAIPEVVKSDAFRQLRESPTPWVSESPIVTTRLTECAGSSALSGGRSPRVSQG